MNEIPKHILSKSTFIRGLQCEKSLYLYKNYYHQRDPIPAERQIAFDRGHEIGKLAQQLFPGGVDASPPSRFKFRESVLKTQKFIESGETIIYEAAFQYKQTLVALDILVKTNKGWCAYEVKSSTKISEVYKLDASIQYFIITNAGLPLQDFSIVHVNNKYKRHGELELEKLFTKVSVLDEVQDNINGFDKQIDSFLTVVHGQNMPEVEIGPHCFSPYECDFRGTCWKDIPNNSVFTLAGSGPEKQFELYNKGYVELSEVPISEKGLTVAQKVQIRGEKIINKKAIECFLEKLQLPFYFLDFETFQSAIPLYEGSNPFEQVPFQYSCHIQDNSGATEHKEYLAEAGVDCREEFLQKLIEDVGKSGTILIYNVAFERTVLNKLAKLYPLYEPSIRAINERMVDLMKPFKDKDYYLPEMNGSHSIKSVLPAVVPELSYKDLEIGNGLLASSSFSALATEFDMFKIQDTRNALLEYCRMDTYAMVKILEKLKQLIQEG